MKKLLFLLLFPLAAQAQIDIAKDTIQLNEVVVASGKTKFTVKQQKRRGPCYAPENMGNATEIITLFDGLKEGYLHSVSFHFNEMFLSGRKQPGTFKDTAFELVVYSVNDDNSPGEKIAHDVMVVTVKKEHKGSINIDLSYLNIESPGRLYVGLKKLSRSIDKTEFFIDCLCSGVDKYTTMVRDQATGGWKRNWVCASLKADISVIVKKR